MKVVKKSVHPSWKSDSPSHDYTIFELERVSAFQPVALGTEADITAGKTAIVLGWGLTETNKQSTVLLLVDVPITANDKCATLLKGSGAILDSSMLCASGEAAKDACEGDSGRPSTDRLERRRGRAHWRRELRYSLRRSEQAWRLCACAFGAKLD